MKSNFIQQPLLKQNRQSKRAVLQVPQLSCDNEPRQPSKWYANIYYLVTGALLGMALTKAQVISWFRIQEMFRLQDFQMYRVLGTAVIVGTLSVALIKKFNIKTLGGTPIQFAKKVFHKGQIWGGLLFGFGWAATGACPGPIFAQIGSGAFSGIIVLLSAIAGTWVYGAIRHKLPH